MIYRQASAVTTVVGMDSPRGWLPAGAVKPLAEPPIPAILDVRLFARGEDFLLAWRPHQPALSQLLSANGEEPYSSETEAAGRAQILFGLDDEDWTFRGDGHPPTADDVARIRDCALAAHGVDLALGLEGFAIARPSLHSFRVRGGEPTQLWVVLGTPGDEYVIFYDPDDGGYGLGSGRDTQHLEYIGDYGTLWTTVYSL